MYDFSQFCFMVADESRMRPYVEALRRSVTPDSIVLDIGAGTGIFSLLACQFGARKVYAIEPNPLINLAREIAAEYGYQNKIEFIQKLSTEIELSEKADVLISDLHGTMPLAGMSVSTIIDARRRLLKPDAAIIPEKDTIYFALVASEKYYQTHISRYLQEYYGISMSAGKRLLTNRAFYPPTDDLKLVSEPQVFAVLNYRSLEERSFSARLKWEMEKESQVHGLRGWFDCEVGNGLTFTTSAENPGNVYGVFFLPLDEALTVEAGDRIEVNLSANFESGTYIWSWNTFVYPKGELEKPKIKLYQSSALGTYTTPVGIQKQSEYFLPLPNEDAEINLLFLQSMDGEMLLGDIADLMLEKFPEKFKTFEEAFSSASMLSLRYSKSE